MTPALVLLVLSPAFASEPPPSPIDEACSSEIGILCRELAGGRLLTCLEEHEGDLLKGCRASVNGERNRLALERADREAAAQEAKIKAEQGDEQEARLVKVTGSVYLRTEAMAQGRFVAAEEGTPLSAGDLIRTGADGTAAIVVEGRSFVLLSQESDFLVVSLHPRESELYLGVGGLVAKIERLLDGGTLRFVTPSAVAFVRGTELAVSHHISNTGSVVAVFNEGKVGVTALAGGPEVGLGPNQEAEILAKGGPQPARPLSAQQGFKPVLLEGQKQLGPFQKDWKPQPARPRAIRRLDLSRKPALGPAAPAGVSPAQHARVYPEARKRQREMRARLSSAAAPKP